MVISIVFVIVIVVTVMIFIVVITLPVNLFHYRSIITLSVDYYIIS